MSRPPDTTIPDDLSPDATLTYKSARLPGQTLPTVQPADPEAFATLSMARWAVHAEGHAPPPASTEPRIRLLRMVGRGGFGEVYEALQDSLGRVIAVKRLREKFYNECRDVPEELARLEHEFRMEGATTAGLEHPNIVPVYDLGADEQGRPLLAMKLVRGTPWDELLRRDDTVLSRADFLARHLPILIDVAQAVAFAHSRGVIHRDLKPNQVMVGEFGEVLLMDWGLAMVFDEAAARESSGAHAPLLGSLRHTASSPSGTPAYMAPEQTERTAERLGPWTDVYLLGGTLYQLLTSFPPHHAPTAHAAFQSAMKGKVVEPRERAPGRDMPPDLEALCLRAMEADPARRVGSARAFVEALQDHLSGSGKRRESAELAAQAEEKADGARGEYKALAEALALLDRAYGLWAENPRVAVVRGRTLAAYARAAIGNGDLKLARLQAERLPEEADQRTPLLDEIDGRERLARSHARQRRLAIAATFVLLAAVIGGGAFYTRELAAARDTERGLRIAAEQAREAEKSARAAEASAKERAQEARASAESLVEFMVTDVGESLRRSGRLDILQTVLGRVQSYFVSLPAEAQTRSSEAQRISALGRVLVAAVQMGDAERAAGTLAEIERVAAAWESGGGDPAIAVMARVTALNGHATLAMLRADGATAAARVAESRALLDRAEDVLDPGKLAVLRMTTRTILASALMLTGTSEECLRELDALEAELAALPPDLPEATPILRMSNRVLVHQLRGDVHLLLLGEPSVALPHYDDGIAFLEAQVEGKATDIGILQSLSTLYSRKGMALERMAEAQAASTDGAAVQGDLKARAFETQRRSLEINELIVAQSPMDVTGLRDLSVSYNLVGLAHEARGELEPAVALYRKAAEASMRVRFLQPANPWALNDVFGRHRYLGQALYNLKRFDEAHEAYRAAMAYAEELLTAENLSSLANVGAGVQGVSDGAQTALNEAFPVAGRVAQGEYIRGRFAEASHAAMLARDWLGRLNDLLPGNDEVQLNRARLCNANAVAALGLSRLDAAEAYLAEGAILAEGLITKAPPTGLAAMFNKQPDLRAPAARCRAGQRLIAARIATVRGESDARAREYEAAIRLLDDIPGAMEDINSKAFRAEALVALGRVEEAAPFIDAARADPGKARQDVYLYWLLRQRGLGHPDDPWPAWQPTAAAE